MNCFPCKGPACNSCRKFDRMHEAARAATTVACKGCGFKARLADEACPRCGRPLIASPGRAK